MRWSNKGCQGAALGLHRVRALFMVGGLLVSRTVSRGDLTAQSVEDFELMAW